MPHEIPFEKYRLGNGLEVILHQARATPIVCVNVWYHVGSKNERPGRTGFAHLFEHMMFQGSKHWDAEYFEPIQESGGQLNGSTSADRTNYWEVVPSNFLELALWLEADRMGFLLDAMTQDKLDNQRDVVKNERRQNYDNRPYGLAREILAEVMYPAGHPYSWLTIGSMDDISAASLDDVMDFHRTWYRPNNATLVIAGDFDDEPARALVEKHFGGLEPGPPLRHLGQWVPPSGGELRIDAEDRVQLERVYIDWHTTPFFSADDAALDILGGILGSGKASRLYERLVYREQVAQDATAFHGSRQVAGQFHAVATAREGTSAAELERVILDEIESLADAGPSQSEVDRMRNQLESDFVRRLEHVGEFGGVADQLNLYNHYTGDPGCFGRDLGRWMAVTPEDVRRVARRYLGDGRAVLTIRPMPRHAPSTSALATSIDRSARPAGGPSPSVRIPALQRRRLGNGLELVVVEHRGLPKLELNLLLGSGGASDPAGKAGLAGMTASLIDEGTATRDALTISRELDTIGAALDLFARIDSAGATLSTLTRHAPAALALLAEVLASPTFPEAELERIRKLRLTRLRQERDQPSTLARKLTNRLLYGDSHPYAVEASGDEGGIEAIGRDDLVACWRDTWSPAGATLIVVGDTSADDAARSLEEILGGWQGKAAAATVADAEPSPREPAINLLDRPGAPQSVVAVTQLGLARSDPDFFPAQLLNAIVGGMFTSRLNLNLREDKGYTYGARSSFSFRLRPGPYIASASVQTEVTGPALGEMLRELHDVREARPVTDDELSFARASLVRGYPRGFETAGQIADRLRQVVLHGLADDYFDTWVDRLEAVTLDDVRRVARELLTPTAASIVVVGDAARVRDQLEALEVAPLRDVSYEGMLTE